MSLKELIGRPINDWSGTDTECACGSCHTLSTSFFVGGGAEEEITDAMSLLAPPGCGVVVLKEDGRDTEELNRRLRRGGYFVYERSLKRRDGYAELESGKVGDNVRAVLGVGGGFVADCAKYTAAYAHLPCGIVARTHASPSFLVPSALIDGGGMPRLFKTGFPKVVVCDTDALPSGGTENAAAFGELASRLTALLDWRFASIVKGERLCEEIFDAALGQVDSLLARLKGVSRHNRQVTRILFESGLKMSALAALEGSSRLYGGGDTACALALEKLALHEQSPVRLQGENEMLFSVLLLDLYPKIFELGDRREFLPPPDNNRRARALTEYFGVSERAAFDAVTPYLPESERSLGEYRTKEYKDELDGLCGAVKSRLKSAYRIFRRLYPDDGFSLGGYLDVSATRLSIALSPEMLQKYTVLLYLKDAGALDSYLPEDG